MGINPTTLVKFFGYKISIVFGDPLVLDRYLFLRRWLPRTNNQESLLDVGCGSGAFTIFAAKRGYEAVGLSWDEENNSKATDRAEASQAQSASFQIQDIRSLGDCKQHREKYDYVLSFESIEHVLDDRKLMISMEGALKPGGRLILTTPNLDYQPITDDDCGPFQQLETGGHVRRGYSSAMLLELCEQSGLKVEAILSCSGFFSQKLCSLQRLLNRIDTRLSWVCTMPLRIIPILFDPIVRRISNWPDFSLCLLAYKPRFLDSADNQKAGPETIIP